MRHDLDQRRMVVQWGNNNLSEQIQILLIDPQPIVRLGAHKVLERSPDLHIAWECDSCRKALSLLGEITPDLIVSEALFPEDECVLSFIKEAHSSQPGLPILVASGQSEDLLAERVFKTGGAGFVDKRSTPTEFLTAIRTVLKGEIYVSSHMASRAMRHYSHHGSHPEEFNPIDRLSNRELEIFNLIGGGSTSRDIANNLNISIKTVETHRGHIKEKLSLAKEQGLVAFACQWVASGGVYKID
jgi:DNA-binding NarL/FixJ family response regulator